MSSSVALTRALGAVDDRRPVGLLGLEHEYELSADGEPVDFRDLIHDLAVPGLRLDPGDTNAYRCTSGLAVTADDEEAEVASPPLPLAADFTEQLQDWASAGRALLDDILPSSITLDGYSTHLSAAVALDDAEAVADLFAATFAPALMLVLDRASSHGVFVRPRHSRLELCCEYAIGHRLRAGAALFAGGARACVLAVTDGLNDGLPPSLAVRPLVALGRCGLELDRNVTFGFDLYAEGREAVLPLRAGGRISAQRYLEETWRSARSGLASLASTGDLLAAERVVGGSLPLGIEVNGDNRSAGPHPLPPSPYGALLEKRHRGALTIEPELATWDFTVFRLRGAHRTGFACVPRSHLERFLTALDAGELDVVLAAFLQAPYAGRTLAAFAQTQEPGLWDEVGRPTDLLPPEPGAETVGSPATAMKAARPGFGQRRPSAVLAEGGTPAAAAVDTGTAGAEAAATRRDRVAKPPIVAVPRRAAPGFAVPPPPPPIPPAGEPTPGRPGRRRAVIIAVVVALVLLVGIALALVLAGGGGGEKVRTSTSTSSSVPETTSSTELPTSAPPATRVPTTRATLPPVTRPTIVATTIAPPVTTRVPPTSRTTVAPTTVPPPTVPPRGAP